MEFEAMMQEIIREIIQTKSDTIDLAYNSPGGLEGWFQVEIFKKLYDRNKSNCSEITREKVYPWKGTFCDFFLKYKSGISVWMELKVDENNKVNYAQAMEADIQKLSRINTPKTMKYAVLISKLTYLGSEISGFKFNPVKTGQGIYNVWVVPV